MRKAFVLSMIAIVWSACGSGAPAHQTATPDDAASGERSSSGGTASSEASEDEFRLAAGIDDRASGVSESKLKPTATEALLKLVVKKKDDDAPISGVVVSAVGADGQKYYSGETDARGYAEMLVPNGAKYTVTYLSLAKADVNMSVTIPAAENATIQLTLYYSRIKAPRPIRTAGQPEIPDDDSRLILEGVVFDTAKATLKPESFPHLERVVEYMTRKPGCRVELSGHTDSVGNAQKNKKLSQDRANAVRQWLIDKGIAGDRIEAVGYGQERPIASNDTEEGRALNRRTEAREL